MRWVLAALAGALVMNPGCAGDRDRQRDADSDDGSGSDADADRDSAVDALADADGDSSADAAGDPGSDRTADEDAVPVDADPGESLGAIAVEVVRPTRIETLADGVIPAGTVLNAIVVGESVEVEGRASGGEPPYDFSWRSSLAGTVGSGRIATLGALAEGDHDLVLEVTDASGATGESAPLPVHVLPATYDWSHLRRPTAPPAEGDWMTPVRHQQRCGSCWAFAALAVVEAQYNIQSGDPDLDLDLAEQTLIDCDTHSLGCVAGAAEQALDGYLRDVGVPVESCNPFLGTDDVCIASCRDGSAPAPYRVESTSFVAAEPGGPRDAVQAWMRYELVHHGPIARTLVNMSGYDPATRRCAPLGGDHYVAVVGYDDGAGAWIAKNSWGPEWNGDGYLEIAYGECAVDASATIVDGVIAP